MPRMIYMDRDYGDRREGQTRRREADRLYEYPESRRYREYRDREEYDDGRYELKRPRNRIDYDYEVRPIGFSYEDNRRGGGRGSHMHGGEYEHGHGEMRSKKPITKEEAEEWSHGLKNADGSKGPHWTFEQSKQVMLQRGFDVDPYEFYLVLNMLYSDFCEVLKNHGIAKMDLYADLAKAWINDPDAVENKTAEYFTYIAE